MRPLLKNLWNAYSGLREDYRYNGGLVMRLMLANYRICHALLESGLPRVLALLIQGYYSVMFRLISIALGGGDLPVTATIGPGVKFAHRLNGTVIHPNARLGSHVTVFHQVTIGMTEYFNGKPLVPTIGDGVTLYPGAKVLGDVVIGSGSIVGANAVVVESIPDGCLILAPKGRVIH